MEKEQKKEHTIINNENAQMVAQVIDVDSKRELIDINAKIKNCSYLASNYKSTTLTCFIATVLCAFLCVFSTKLEQKFIFYAVAILTIVCAGLSIFMGICFLKQNKQLEAFIAEKSALEPKKVQNVDENKKEIKTLKNDEVVVTNEQKKENEPKIAVKEQKEKTQTKSKEQEIKEQKPKSVTTKKAKEENLTTASAPKTTRKKVEKTQKTEK